MYHMNKPGLCPLPSSIIKEHCYLVQSAGVHNGSMEFAFPCFVNLSMKLVTLKLDTLMSG